MDSIGTKTQVNTYADRSTEGARKREAAQDPQVITPLETYETHSERFSLGKITKDVRGFLSKHEGKAMIVAIGAGIGAAIVNAGSGGVVMAMVGGGIAGMVGGYLSANLLICTNEADTMTPLGIFSGVLGGGYGMALGGKVLSYAATALLSAAGSGVLGGGLVAGAALGGLASMGLLIINSIIDKTNLKKGLKKEMKQLGFSME